MLKKSPKYAQNMQKCPKYAQNMQKNEILIYKNKENP
jgi:hypothetical protein